MRFKLTESIALPKEGFFWEIDGEIIGYSEEVPEYGYEYKQSKTHEQCWDILKPDSCDKSFDHYPRGRVMVDPEYDRDNKFIGYSVMIFIDPCLDNYESKSKIVDFYNLDLSKVQHIMWMGNLKERAGIHHYTCHKCR